MRKRLASYRATEGRWSGKGPLPRNVQLQRRAPEGPQQVYRLKLCLNSKPLRDRMGHLKVINTKLKSAAKNWRSKMCLKRTSLPTRTCDLEEDSDCLDTLGAVLKAVERENWNLISQQEQLQMNCKENYLTSNDLSKKGQGWERRESHCDTKRRWCLCPGGAKDLWGGHLPARSM